MLQNFSGPDGPQGPPEKFWNFLTHHPRSQKIKKLIFRNGAAAPKNKENKNQKIKKIKNQKTKKQKTENKKTKP